MRQYEETEETQKLTFARLAAEHFAQNPQHVTFTKKGIDKGELMALRWGMGNDCVVVVKLCDYDEPVNYVQFIPREKAKLCDIYHQGGEKALAADKNKRVCDCTGDCDCH